MTNANNFPSINSTAEIRYINQEIPHGEPVEVAEGILLLRLRMPFALDHINVYLLDEGDSWTLIDCGINTSITMEDWESALQSEYLKHYKIKRILVTHHHPDHIGLAGWLSEKFNAPLLMSHGEYQVANRYADPNRDIVAERLDFWSKIGLPSEVVPEVMSKIPRYSKNVLPLPQNIEIIDLQKNISIGKRTWRILIGKGHSPEHVSLFNETDDLLISGDQVLPQISPNISVWPNGDLNPLQSYFDTLEQFIEIGKDPLVLPSHKTPMRGLTRRVLELYHHHDSRLEALLKTCQSEKTCYDILPCLFERELKPAELSFGLGEGLAHLNYLVGKGQMTVSKNEDGLHFYKTNS